MLGLDYPPNQKRAVYALIGVAAVAISVIFARNSMSDGGVVLREPGGAQSGVVATDSDPLGGSSDKSGEVIVHVAGAVRSPNVYRLPSGKRVIDAINAAGGATPDANTQSLNLAAKIEDGSRIDVPSINGAPARAGAPSSTLPSSYVPKTATTTASASTASGDKFRNPGDGTVSINSASSEQLQRLPGVGPSTAQKILDYRQQVGRFSSIEQLMDVKGIGPKKLEKIRAFVTL